MSEHLHPGPHPDTDALSAFIEGVLSEHERLQCLAHFAECDRCREVVFVALEPEPVPVAPNRPPFWKPWFAPIPVLSAAAAVCIIAVAAWIYLYRTPAPAHDLTARVLEAPLPAATPPVREEAQAPPPATAPAKRESLRPHRRGIIDDEFPGFPTRPFVREQPSIPPPPPLPIQELLPPPVFGASVSPPPVVPAEVYDGRGLPLDRSGITGTVSDQSGAIIPGAAVTLHQVGGMSSANAVTDTNGKYKVTGLSAGRYELQISAPGFQRTSRQIDLPARELAVVTSELSVGSVTETVEVTAATPVISTENASMSSVLHPLPSKLPIDISITSGKVILALDSEGTLFLSRNRGKRWKAVKPVWHDKVTDLAKTDTPSAANFQLTTESGADWLSRDGSHWYPAPQK